MSPLAHAFRDFGITYLFAAVLMILLDAALGLAGTSVTVASCVVPMVAAVFVAGGRCGERTGERPGMGACWQFSLVASLTAVVIVAGLACAFLMTAGEARRVELAPVIFNPVLIGIGAVTMVSIHMLALRYLFELAAARGALAHRPGMLDGVPHGISAIRD